MRECMRSELIYLRKTMLTHVCAYVLAGACVYVCMYANRKLPHFIIILSVFINFFFIFVATTIVIIKIKIREMTLMWCTRNMCALLHV